MKKTFLLGFMLILLAAFTLAVPGVPHTFNGTVTINDAPAPDGTTVSATVDGVTRGSGSTVDGMFGKDEPFQVLDPDNLYGTYHPDIRFYVDGYDTGETVAFVAGETTEVYLSITKSSSSSSGSSGGGGGGGGGGSLLFGTDLWDCDEWSKCENGEQFQTCTQGDTTKVNTRDCEDDTSGLAPPTPPGFDDESGEEDLLASPGAPPITGSAVSESDGKSFFDRINDNWLVPFLAGMVIVLVVIVLVLTGRRRKKSREPPMELRREPPPPGAPEQPKALDPFGSEPSKPKIPNKKSPGASLDFEEMPDFDSGTGLGSSGLDKSESGFYDSEKEPVGDDSSESLSEFTARFDELPDFESEKESEDDEKDFF